MLYRPEKERQWDSWIFKQGDTYFMYYINVSDGGTRWDGISLATSSDLIHWKEYGRVLTKDADAIWLGTGMVQKVGDKYIMNYSLEKPAGYQKIYFAQSSDLFKWEKVEEVVSEPDGKIYMLEPNETCDPSPRWDSLGIFEPLSNNPPPYYAFCSSNIKGAKLCEKSGVLGLVTSNDGLHWSCLPPAFANPEVFPSCEVPEYLTFNGRHYAIFCTSSNLGYRCDSLAEFMSGGTYYLVSDEKTKNYRLPKGDPLLQGTRDNSMVTMNYVGRTFIDKGKTCFYHIWGEPCSDAYMGLVKEVYEKAPYELALRYLDINEKIKGKDLFEKETYKAFSEARRVGMLHAVNWGIGRRDVIFKSNGSSGALVATLNGSVKTNSYTDIKDGRVVEADITFNGLGAGVYFETVNGKRACVMLNKPKNRVEFSFLRDGWGGNMYMFKDVFKTAAIKDKQTIKLFARRMFLELYIDGDYIAGWRLDGDEINPNRFGIYSEDSDGKLENLKIYEMK